MYTKCPECRTAFRLNAKILKAAQGRVRCGGCDTTFNALDHLSEDLPDDDSSNTRTARVFEARSKELLESLDQLAGPGDIRIEDTGVEWRVLDIDDDDSDNDNQAEADEPGDAAGATASEPHDDDAGAPVLRTGGADSQAGSAMRTPGDDDGAAGAGPGTAEETVQRARDGDHDGNSRDEATTTGGKAGALEVTPQNGDDLRFDDHTPLPDEFFRPVDEDMLRQLEGERDAESTATADPGSSGESAEPAAAASLGARGNEDAGVQQADLEFGDDDWEDLLDEVESDDDAASASPQASVAAAAADEDAKDPEAADTAAGPGPEVASGDTRADAEDDASPAAAGDDAQDSDEHDLAEDEPAGDASEEPDAPGDAVDGAGAARGDRDEAETDHAHLDPEQSMAMEIDSALMQAAAESAWNDEEDRAPAGEEDAEDDAEDSLMESIIMEGDTVTGLEVPVEEAAYDDIPPPDDDETDAAAGRWRRVGAAAAVLVLGLALLAQLVHANREKLATLDAFSTAVAPIYRALGQDVVPAWDVRGWRFESTSGSTDGNDRHLTITSRIANRSDGPLPLPLVHVSLTDRYEEVIGSRVLEPSEYLPGARHADAAVPAGQSFTAVVNVNAPAPDATGFKLNVCYRQDGGGLRCAIEDFKRR